MEQRRNREQRAGTTLGGGGSPFAATADGLGMATVSHGPFAEQLPVANRTVGEIRERFGQRLDASGF